MDGRRHGAVNWRCNECLIIGRVRSALHSLGARLAAIGSPNEGLVWTTKEYSETYLFALDRRLLAAEGR